MGGGILAVVGVLVAVFLMVVIINQTKNNGAFSSSRWSVLLTMNLKTMSNLLRSQSQLTREA